MTEPETLPIELPDVVGAVPERMRGIEMALLYVVSLGGALFLSGALVALTGNSWGGVFGALLDGALLAPGRWGSTLEVAAPLLLVAIGMVIGLKAGMFNIGQEGQLLIGAMAMAAVGTKLGGPGPLLVILGLVAGFVAGGLYAGVAAVMRNRRGVPEVISTLLLVFVAYQVIGFAVTTDWLLRDVDPDLPTRAVTSEALSEAVQLPVIRILGSEFHLGIVIAVVVALVAAYVLGRTVWGFRIRLLGYNPNVARTMGVAGRRTGSAALFLSGALAGMAGAVMLLGGASGSRLTTGFALQYGWQGLLVALLARGRPLLCIPMALLFAGLRTGAGFLASTGVDRQIVDVVQALLVLALLIPPAVQFLRRRRQTLAAAANAGEA